MQIVPRRCGKVFFSISFLTFVALLPAHIKEGEDKLADVTGSSNGDVTITCN
jgi:hypothetical protein